MSTLTIPSDLYSTDPGTVSGKERYENMWEICITLSLCAFVIFRLFFPGARVCENLWVSSSPGADGRTPLETLGIVMENLFCSSSVLPKCAKSNASE